MLKLFLSSLKLLYRDKQTLFWALVFPVMFAVVFGLFDFTGTPEVSITIVADQRSAVGSQLEAALDQINSFHVRSADSLEAATRRLEDGETDVVVGVPATVPSSARGPSPGSTSEPRGQMREAGPSAPLRVLYNRANFQENQFALQVIDRVIGQMNLRMAGVESPPLSIRQQAVAGKSVDYYDFLLPGLVAMGVMNFSIVGMGVAVARFREQRILKRILATPLRPVKFLAAQIAARLVLALVQTGVILGVGTLLFGGRIYGNLLWLFSLAMVANIVFLNIGFAVAGRSPNSDAAQGIGQAVSLPMMFLSGVFFPTESLPAAVEAVVQFLPLTPLIDALRAVSLEGASILELGPELGLLGLWMAASFLLAKLNFRFAGA